MRTILLTVAVSLVAVPAFATNRHYCAPVYHKAAAVKVVEQVQYPTTVIENQQIFYSAGSQVRDYAMAPQAVLAAERGQIERKVERLRQELEQYTAQLQPPPQPYYAPLPQYYAPQYQQQPVCQGQQCPPPQQQAPPQHPWPTPPQDGENQAPDEGDRPSFSQQQRPIIDQHCAKCHGAGKGEPKGGVDLTQNPLPLETKLKALGQAASGNMPPEKSGPALTQTEVQRMADEILSDEEQKLLGIFKGRE